MSGAPIFQPSRREVMAGLAATMLPVAMPVCRADAAPFSRVRPGMAGWPDEAAWDGLGRAVGGRLAPVTLPAVDPGEAHALLADPFYLRDQAGLTQSSGWVDCWRSAPSAYAVHARDAADVRAAVRFAVQHRLRLVVRGAGHSYLGGSNAPDSLLVWMRDMEAITLHDAFVPQGSAAAPVAAVSVGAGCVWGHVYDAVTTQGGRYVQGGGCTSVGVAGLVQGGGFGSYSKNYGLAAASLLEAEIVTADGAVRIVNDTQEPDLFWALKGGGGGTFGVVTRLTLRTHDLPALFGVVNWSVTAGSDAAFRRLIGRFLDVYAERMFNPHWGEQARLFSHNRFEIMMLFQGIDAAAAQDCWKDLQAFVMAAPQDYVVTQPFRALAVPARHMWDEAFLQAHLPTALVADKRPGARVADWWWSGNTDEAGTFWHGYTSAWLPATLLAAEGRAKLADAWFAASRHWSVTLHFNKGLAGGSEAARAASAQTAMNPQVLDAFALAIIAMDGHSAYAPLPPPDMADARDDAVRIRAAMTALLACAPGAGSYLSECDYGLSDWREACWGAHARRLDAVKARYDPDGLFFVHHGVGSERWSADGFTRVG